LDKYFTKYFWKLLRRNFVRSSGDKQNIWFKTGGLNQQGDCFAGISSARQETSIYWIQV